MKKSKSKSHSKNSSKPHQRLSQLCQGIASDISALGLDKANTRPTKSDIEKQERKEMFKVVQKQIKNLS